MNVRQIVVTGVAASGKTTVGRALAAQLGFAFVDGDSLHPESNVAKMAAGHALDDQDRWPWLAAVRSTLRRGGVVVACSGLRRTYRDMLRLADGTAFVHLAIDEATATSRAASRADHFMAADMVASQFAALESPTEDEADVAVVDATAPVDDIVRAATTLLAGVEPGRMLPDPVVALGSPTSVIDDDQLRSHATALADRLVDECAATSVLLVPPDHTRAHSRAGLITVALRERLLELGCKVGVLPALGTHRPMNDGDAHLLFGGALRADDLLVHDWRRGLRSVGSLDAAEVEVATSGRYAEAIEIAVDEELFAGWDHVVSIGQVVPHEVIGMANFTKNLVIGLGGGATIHRSHFVGAVAGMESIMGRPGGPVRELVDAAFDRFVGPLVRVTWVLTVVEDRGPDRVVRGLFIGDGASTETGGSAFLAAADLAATVNVTTLERPVDRAVCRLDPDEFRSTWLANKAIYRLRMAMADAGELIVLAPGVRQFGEDPVIDELIRRHGYRGTPATLAALDLDPELAASLASAAHLIHGSSEGRFRIVYCTDPDSGGLTRHEIESVGFEWRSLPDELARLSLADAEHASAGERFDCAGKGFFYVPNPALGLWCSRQA